MLLLLLLHELASAMQAGSGKADLSACASTHAVASSAFAHVYRCKSGCKCSLSVTPSTQVGRSAGIKRMNLQGAPCCSPSSAVAGLPAGTGSAPSKRRALSGSVTALSVPFAALLQSKLDGMRIVLKQTDGSPLASLGACGVAWSLHALLALSSVLALGLLSLGWRHARLQR